MGKGTAKKFAIGTALAAAVGFVAGVLTAPKSGKETRQDIKSVAEKAADETEQQLKKLYADLDKLVGDARAKGGDLSGRARKELDGLLENAGEAKHKASGIIDALRREGATDKELKKAIDEANKAIDHLRNYLQK